MQPTTEELDHSFEFLLTSIVSGVVFSYVTWEAETGVPESVILFMKFMFMPTILIVLAWLYNKVSVTDENRKMLFRSYVWYLTSLILSGDLLFFFLILSLPELTSIFGESSPVLGAFILILFLVLTVVAVYAIEKVIDTYAHALKILNLKFFENLRMHREALLYALFTWIVIWIISFISI